MYLLISESELLGGLNVHAVDAHTLVDFVVVCVRVSVVYRAT